MLLQYLRDLKDRGLLSDADFQRMEPILNGTLVSVFYELRTLLYLGVLLFTTGAGILVYKNIGDVGHLIAIAALFLLTAGCYFYAVRKAPPYSNFRITPPTLYYDYVVLLASLLFVSLLGYLQYKFELFNEGLGETTLITSALFFYSAYRFDHAGVLTLAITAFASFWSLRLSPQEWYSGNFFDNANLHNTALIFGGGLAAVALVLHRRRIKSHFTFSYINFCSLVYLSGAVTGMFMKGSLSFYFIALLAGCSLLARHAYRERSFLFILYAAIFGYIGITYVLTDLLPQSLFTWSLYLIASCGGFVVFILKFRSRFKRAQ